MCRAPGTRRRSRSRLRSRRSSASTSARADSPDWVKGPSLPSEDDRMPRGRAPMEPQRLQPADLIADAARDLARQSYASQPPIAGVVLDDVRVFSAPDGLFAELARLDGGRQVGGFPGFRPVQWNWSMLEPGAVKAWHLHLAQDDLWIV